MNSGKILWGNVFWGKERFLMRREDAREMSILLTASPGYVSHFYCVTVRWQEKLQQCCIQRARLIFYSCQTIPPISEILQVSAQTTKPPVSVLIFMRWKNAHMLSIVTHIYMIYEYICMYTHMCICVCVCVRVNDKLWWRTDETILSQYLLYCPLYSKGFIVWALASLTVWLLDRLTNHHLIQISTISKIWYNKANYHITHN